MEVPEEEPGDPAREGTCAAWVAEKVLAGEVERCADLIGESHENGWLVEAEMARLIQKYVDFIRADGGDIHTERKVRLNPMIEGTPDAFAVYADGWLKVKDLKYGYAVVEPYRNTQVSIYAGAIVRKLEARGHRVSRVEIGIYQPRAWHPEGVYRRWVIWPEQLMEFVREIELAGHDCQDLTSRATPGHHCQHCPAAARCTALAHSIYRGYQTVTDNRAQQMTPEEMVQELDFLDRISTMIEARKKAVETEAMARMRRAEHFPGYAIDYERFGNRKFNVDPEIVKAITGIDPFMDAKPCTPAELIRRGSDRGIDIEDTVNTLSSRPRIPPKLVKMNPNHYRNIFNKKDQG